MERSLAATAAAVTVAVVSWLAAPGGGTAAVSGSAPARVATAGAPGYAPSAGPGAAGGAGTGAPSSVPVGAGNSCPAAVTTGGGPTARTAPGAASPQVTLPSGPGPRDGVTGASCPSPGARSPGVSATEINVAVTLTTIVGPAGNSTFGLPSVADQQTYYQDVIDALNASGGVACRRVVPHFYQVNAADQSDQEQKCLDIAQSGVFAELDFTAYATVGGNCFAQKQLPFFIDYFLTAQDTDQLYPYLFGLNTYDSLYRNTIYALHQRGFFDQANGFRKLGFVYRSCFPTIPPEVMAELQQVGVAASDVVTYDVGCPAAFATPSDLEQAVLKFQQSGVTNVTTAYFLGDFANFTTIAQQQHFNPRYGIGDDGTINVSYGSQHPDYSNIDGALAVTASSYGEEHTPGLQPAPATNRCNAIYAAKGAPPVYQQNTGAGGLICDELWMFAAAVDHAPVLSQQALAAGLQAAGTVPFSYPEGPNTFAGARTTTGGQYWRTDQFSAACTCWKVIDPTFHPSF